MKYTKEQIQELIELTKKTIFSIEENIVIHSSIIDELEHELILSRKKLNFFNDLLDEKI